MKFAQVTRQYRKKDIVCVSSEKYIIATRFTYYSQLSVPSSSRNYMFCLSKHLSIALTLITRLLYKKIGITRPDNNSSTLRVLHIVLFYFVYLLIYLFNRALFTCHVTTRVCLRRLNLASLKMDGNIKDKISHIRASYIGPHQRRILKS